MVQSKEQHADCPFAAVRAAVLDAAAVTYLKRVALDPAVLEWEIGRLAEASDTNSEDLKAVDDRLAAIKRKQHVLTATVETLDDPDAAEPLLERLRSLAAEKRGYEREREAIVARLSTSAGLLTSLRGIKDQAAELSRDFDRLSYQAKRDLIAALNLTATIWPSSAPDRYTFKSDADGLLEVIGLQFQPVEKQGRLSAPGAAR